MFATNGTSGLADVVGSIEEHVYALAREAGNAPQSFKEDVQAFVAAVDWTEGWIQLLLAGHAVLWATTLVTRRVFSVQAAVFFFICLVVFASERLNTLARERWTDFSRQNYFDENGFFVAVMLDGPLLALAMFQMLNFLSMASHLLVEVKREELQRSKKARDRRQARPPDGGGDGRASSKRKKAGMSTKLD